MILELVPTSNMTEVMGTRVWPADASCPREGEKLEHGGRWYDVAGVEWPEKPGHPNHGAYVRVLVKPAFVKGSVTVEPGFSEQEGWYADKGLPGGS